MLVLHPIVSDIYGPGNVSMRFLFYFLEFLNNCICLQKAFPGIKIRVCVSCKHQHVLTE